MLKVGRKELLWINNLGKRVILQLKIKLMETIRNNKKEKEEINLEVNQRIMKKN